MENKVILTDCDGVLLDWESKFETWVTRLGFRYLPHARSQYGIDEQLGIGRKEASALIARFNSGSDFARLPAWRDSVEVVQRLHSQGWKFVVITTAGLHPWTWGLRRSNLDRVFGDNVIEELHVLELHGNKGEKLQDFKDSGFYWIEDKPSNAELGYKFGLKPLLMDSDFNKNATGIPRVNTWAEIEKIINDDHPR